MLRRGDGQSVHRVRPGRVQHVLHGPPVGEEHHLAAEQTLPGTTGRLSRAERTDNILDYLAGDSGHAGREHVEKGCFCELRDGPVQLFDS